MPVKIEKSWNEQLISEFGKNYFLQLINFLKRAYATKNILPPESQIFNAFNCCPFDKMNVVIVGQDPYHGLGQANGLCFSVSEGIKHPPSLQNIFKEIQDDIGSPIPQSGDLTRWSAQGVLLLNSMLTVEAGKAGSHQNKGWEYFTDSVLKIISQNKKQIVFLLWGAYAQKKESFIDSSKHLILKAPHPSPLSAYSGFFGCKHFSKTNQYLMSNELTQINW